jgi:murein DD-endopeptidase MepM/ murein hydrolase activator NlpD
MRELKGIAFLLLTGLLYYSLNWLEPNIFSAQDDISADSLATADSLAADSLNLAADSLPEPQLLYGFIADSFEVVETRIRRNQSLGQILSDFGIDGATVHNLAQKSREVFDVRRLKANKPLTVLMSKDSAHKAEYVIYEHSPTDYVVFSLSDSLGAEYRQKEVLIREKSILGTISNSLAQSIEEAGGSPALTSMLVDVYAWQIDFFRIQKGDNFRLIYEEKFVDDESVGLGRILAAQFSHAGETFNAYYFDQGEGSTYYDENGNSLRKAFLKAPLNFSRISSRYSLRRFHPVQKRYKAHLGTDYAAPTGTPIYTVGDGVIVEAGYNRGNGNYVKVRHNGTYTTQYLHMSRIAKGIRKGQAVRQGQTIGYVGSTGLATGPHLCFRFWKNGRQVDPFRVEMPPSDPIVAAHREAFDNQRMQYAQQLAMLEPNPETEVLQAQAGTQDITTSHN